MKRRTQEITKYFRSAVSAQANMGVDFKVDNYHIINLEELLRGEVTAAICEEIFVDAQKNTSNDEDEARKKSSLHVIICAKTIKTIFDANSKVQDEIEELTGLFYIPAVLEKDGKLKFDDGDKKLPWFPREYLQPMIEPKLAIGDADSLDKFMSNHVDQIEKIQSWSDYVAFFQELYESVTDSKFEQKTIRNLDAKEPYFELENNMYVFLDKTVIATYHILNLYNYLQENDQPNALYENFVSTKVEATVPLFDNTLATMQSHCGQMGGKYPLSPSQREVVNHFNAMRDGDILAVNGPPGTGKTTLLQSIVADMYVKRAINKEKAPLIIAASTNNQAVTNIIDSFGKIEPTGIANLEERWIEGVKSFAVYFPSARKEKESKEKGYQYTNQKGEFFVADVDNKENIEKSRTRLVKSCNEYFRSKYQDISACQNKLHEELLFVEKSKDTLLSLAHEFVPYSLDEEDINNCIRSLEAQIEERKTLIAKLRQRVREWEQCYQKIPFLYRLLNFIKSFSKKIQTEFRLFINNEELGFINEYMSLDEIKEKYSLRLIDFNTILSEVEKKKKAVEEIKKQYDDMLTQLQQHHIILHKNDEDKKYKLQLDYINNLIDEKIRYVEFWLAVHYFECRWVRGEDTLSEQQKGRNFKNVLEQFYNRLSMLAPCLVMTFFMLPKQFLAYGDQKKFYLYDYIDLLIVDESGQVSPEIAAGAFSLAKRAIVVGDIYQIEPVWSVNRALDKALAMANGAIKELEEFALLEQTGLNTSNSSVMKVAAKCCKYEKFDDRGLFLSEHRRCYNEIIEYCNELIYKGNLQPMRGKGKQDKKLAIPQWPQMGFKQIDSDNSIRKGSSRLNKLEAEQIVAWLKNNFSFIEAAYPDEKKKENLVGIITPFKAQVKCIEAELKKQMPQHYSFISVGTIHTFQGADRNIIILSTVYGKLDGCFFIDANKSLMNVAVSRAKDNFFVFGDINCLKDVLNSASGLLKKCVDSGVL
ncbi:hypothetical protein SRRS_07540 [Sporomusa rhizae]|uniref:DEAD/DEAH box helicase n=1 Tax=Sporomusa rhizae TaxID=357999 RepID=UPI00352A1374